MELTDEKIKVRIEVRELVNKLPVHLDTSMDMEEAIVLITEYCTKTRRDERARCLEIAREHSCRSYSELCDCSSEIVSAIRTGSGPE